MYNDESYWNPHEYKPSIGSMLKEFFIADELLLFPTYEKICIVLEQNESNYVA